MEQEVPELERVKRLINKLFERTSDRGFTEHEALEASAKVDGLLKQFDLTLEECVIRDEKCVQREVYADDDFACHVVGGIARLCSLKNYHVGGSTPPTYVLYGFPRDIELAVFLYEVLMEALANDWGQYSVVHGFQRKKRESFRQGFSSRVYDRLVSMREQRDAEAAARSRASSSTNLVVVRDSIVEEEFEKTGVRLVSRRGPRVHDSAGYWAGHAAGDRAPIQTPLNGEGKSLLT